MRTAQCLLAASYAAQSGALLMHQAADTHQEAAPVIPHFDEFLETFDRAYAAGSGEYKLRREAYEARAEVAREQNGKQGRLWTAGVSYLWDMTQEEYAMLRGYVRGARPSGSGGLGSGSSGLVQVADAPAAPLPEEKSWAHLVAQRHIRNQGACGSCWAIAGSTVLQAHAQIHTGKVRSFSAQQLVSCVQNPQHCGGDGGCRGATVELAYAWVMNNGLAEDYQVPYAGTDGTCGSNASQAVTHGSPSAFGMKGWERLPENKYEPLMRALAERGPVAVSVSAGPWAVYETGIFDACSPDAILDHAVVLTGYGSVPLPGGNVSTRFWTIQNSWGESWGEGGKIRLVRHVDEEAFCGIDDEPAKGTGCVGGPAQVKVCGTCGILYDNVVPHF